MLFLYNLYSLKASITKRPFFKKRDESEFLSSFGENPTYKVKDTISLNHLILLFSLKTQFLCIKTSIVKDSRFFHV